MGKSLRASMVVMGCLSLLTGCTQYYKVVDPASRREYITTDWVAMRYGWTGTLRFHDLKSRRDVTLPSSEVERISSDEAKIEISAAKAAR
jgi:hypothetical protein